MNITYYGHSAFLLNIDNYNILIDPFISGNPQCKAKVEDLPKIDYILLTHGHADHIGDTFEIEKNNDITIITINELANYLISKGCKNVIGNHYGSELKMPFGTVKTVYALHSSSFDDEDGHHSFGSTASGLVITDNNGKKLYHSGDTALTMEMKLLEDENIDLALLPVGGHYTLNIKDAVKATSFIKPKAVMPMHYVDPNYEDLTDEIKQSWGYIIADPSEFKTTVEKTGTKCLLEKPNTTFIL